LRALDLIGQAVPMRPAVPVRCAVLAALALVGPLAGAGCGPVGEAQQVINRADLVNDLARRLNDASELTYTAEYQLASGETATIAQASRPTRSAYTYPGGKVVISTTATAECKSQGSGTLCALTGAPLSTEGPPAVVLDAARAHGLVYPTLAMGLLTTAALDKDAVIEQADATIAGQHATCVDVSQVENAAASAFKACITADGVLGSFSGDLGGQRVEVSLLSYANTAPATAFDLPAGAKIVDHRKR
jgi:hypothetical protein